MVRKTSSPAPTRTKSGAAVKKLSVNIPADTWRRLAHAAIDADKDMGELVTAALETYLPKLR